MNLSFLTVFLARSSEAVRVAYAMVMLVPLYLATYFWKSPMFTLPESYANVSVCTVGDARLDLQTSLAAGQTLGFFLGKLPAMLLMASPVFFRYRYAAMVVIMFLAAAFNGVGIALFDRSGALASPLMQAIAAGCASAIFSSAVFGGIVTWLEGRRATELLFATLNLAVVLAGGIGRGYGVALLGWGVAPRWMPLVASSSGFCLAAFFLALLAQLPAQTAGDTAQRGERGAMSHAQRAKFCARFAPGIAVSLAAYLVIMSLRGFRDFYALELYTDALGGAPPSSLLLFLADAPGGILSCVMLALLSTVKRNKSALVCMSVIMLLGVLTMLLATVLYRFQLIGGIAWLVTIGAGIYVAYLPMGSPFYDRLMAASGGRGTVTFMVFAADGVGYLGTLALLAWKTFATTRSSTAAQRDGSGARASRSGGPSALFSTVSLYACAALLVLLVLQVIYFATTLGDAVSSEVEEGAEEELLSTDDMICASGPSQGQADGAAAYAELHP